MTVYQLAFVVLAALAIVAGRPPATVCVAIAGNFAASVFIAKLGLPVSQALLWTGLVDALTVIAMIGASRRGDAAALCYALMIFVYPAAYAFGWGLDLTFSIIEGLGVLALAVIGGMDRGIRLGCRWVVRALGVAGRGRDVRRGLLVVAALEAEGLEACSHAEKIGPDFAILRR